ncbi:MAG: archaeosortase/exosortase family protein [Candidatus Nanoarchaeia archaeon]
MDKNVKQFAIKSALLIGALLIVTFLFRFPIDYFNLKLLSMNEATRIFSKSDAIKVMALAALFFTIYCKDKIATIVHEKRNLLKTSIYLAAGLVFVAIYYFLRYLANANNITSGAELYLMMIGSIITLFISFVLFTLGIFSLSYMKRFYKLLKKEIWVTIVLSAVAYYLLMLFQSLWPLFSFSISRLLFSMFSPLFPTYLELGEVPLLEVNDFAVTIGAPCSGIESIFLFAAFSIGIFVLDHTRLKKKIFIITSIVGIVGIYFVNVLRLFLLILTGIYIDPDFAVGMFHTNVGWILFAIYFLIYYLIIRKFIYKSSSLKRK